MIASVFNHSLGRPVLLQTNLGIQNPPKGGTLDFSRSIQVARYSKPPSFWLEIEELFKQRIAV
jgi:hypothetical protein